MSIPTILMIVVVIIASIGFVRKISLNIKRYGKITGSGYFLESGSNADLNRAISEPILYLNTTAATSRTVLHRRVSEYYRHWCKIFEVGVIDRTGTLDPGFEFANLAPIPPVPDSCLPLETGCDLRANAIVEEARALDKEIRVFWSGGIDSTAALCAILNAADAAGERERLLVVLRRESIAEFPRFYSSVITRQVRTLRLRRILEGIADSALCVTGEHGDQLFGSAKTARYQDVMFDPWESAFPKILQNAGGGANGATMLRYVEPQIAACPIPLPNLFMLFWWFNFSMKWQSVALRMAVAKGGDVMRTRQSIRHFFDTIDFQQWSLANPDLRIKDTWQSYKAPLKDYINRYFPDPDYHASKVKIPSLQGFSSFTKRKVILTGTPTAAGLVASSALIMSFDFDGSFMVDVGGE